MEPNADIIKAGDWLYGTLSPTELKKIIGRYDGTPQEWYESIFTIYTSPIKSEIMEHLQGLGNAYFNCNLNELLKDTPQRFGFEIKRGKPVKK